MSKPWTRRLLINAGLTVVIGTFALRLYAGALVEENRQLLRRVVQTLERDCVAGDAHACAVAHDGRNSAGEFLDLSERCEYGDRGACQVVAQYRQQLVRLLQVSKARGSQGDPDKERGRTSRSRNNRDEWASERRSGARLEPILFLELQKTRDGPLMLSHRKRVS